VVAAEREAIATGVGRLEGTALFFYLYLAVIVIEYLGLAKDIPILELTRFSTITIYLLLVLVLMKVGGEAFTRCRQSRLLGIFVLFSAITVPIAVVSTTALGGLRAHVDYFALFLLTVYLVDRPARVRTVAATAAVIIVVLVVRNVDALTGNARAVGIRGGYFMGDGNDFSWGLNLLMPWCIFLVLTRQGLLVRALGAAGVLSALLGIIGTQSRGATLALAASGLFYWVFMAKRKGLGLVAIGAAVAIVLVLAPPGYFQRMQTIQNYEEDNSARARLQAWGAATKMAIDFPLGVGANNFGSAYGRYYIPAGDANTLTWAAGRWLSAHSVYFRLLGEYGIFGVVWVFILLSSNFKDNMSAHRVLSASPNADAPPAVWPLMLNMSLVAYAVAGIFLGGVAYPHLYLLSGLIASARRQSHWAQAAAHTATALPVPVRNGLNPRPAVIPDARVPVGAARAAATGRVMDVAERARMMTQHKRG
jgi:probable O-glycosylation ligase (exosortase A-associated)